MGQVSLTTHLVVLAAMVVNLWVGGDLIEGWAGHTARSAFEIVLIAGYVVLVLGYGRLGSESDERDEQPRR
ncbi:MAG: hypothetical protein DWI48_05495 [Chloroflexi bacterium]|nr:MAG: hypothetical protein DWI48_05495 [Chloroflexota bacterium]